MTGTHLKICVVQRVLSINSGPYVPMSVTKQKHSWADCMFISKSIQNDGFQAIVKIHLFALAHICS